MLFLHSFVYFTFLRIIDGETRIGIFALRDIKKGEHLTYDYQYECLPDSLPVNRILFVAFHALIIKSEVLNRPFTV